MTNVTADEIQSLFTARTVAEARMMQARADLGDAEINLRCAALAAFIQALSARGIVKGGHVVIEGQHSGPWGGRVRDIKHDAIPVFLHSVTVDSAPATRPHENSTDKWWWFRLSIARLKKDGKPRNECRNLVVHGDTPEAAAAQIKSPLGMV